VSEANGTSASVPARNHLGRPRRDASPTDSKIKQVKSTKMLMILEASWLGRRNDIEWTASQTIDAGGTAIGTLIKLGFQNILSGTAIDSIVTFGR
jgi:autotransporter passenger strand-loop-strand repeat protein